MQKDNEIRTLRAQHKQKEMILKRKQEEVKSLVVLRFFDRNISFSRFISYDVKCVQLVYVRPPKK